MPTRNALDTLATVVSDGGFDPDRAYGYIQLLDCNLLGARGLELTLSSADARTRINYMVDGVPSTTATETSDGGVSIAFVRAQGQVFRATERGRPIYRRAENVTGDRTRHRARPWRKHSRDAADLGDDDVAIHDTQNLTRADTPEIMAEPVPEFLRSDVQTAPPARTQPEATHSARSRTEGEHALGRSKPSHPTQTASRNCA